MTGSWLDTLKAGVDAGFWQVERGEETSPLPTFPALEPMTVLEPRAISVEMLRRGVLPLPNGDERHIDGLPVVGDDLERYEMTACWSNRPRETMQTRATMFYRRRRVVELDPALARAAAGEILDILSWAIAVFVLQSEKAEELRWWRARRYGGLIGEME